jgi:pimeloyl-ACP methyl ester carboxylesterase
MSVLNVAGAAGAASEKQNMLANGIEIAFQQIGEGKPVVFVHGLAEDGGSWREIVTLLPSGICASLVDLRGHGGTSAGQGNGTAAQLGADIVAFLEKVTGPAVCVGFSLGGVVVLEAALERPDLVRKVIVVGTSSKVGQAAAKFFAERIALLEEDRTAFGEALAADTEAQLSRNKQRSSDVAARRIAAVGAGAGYVNASRAMIALSAAPMTDRLRQIKVPVHIIQGLDDVFCPRRAADILREAMPTATYADIADAGHLIAVDQPEALAREIVQAIQS